MRLFLSYSWANSNEADILVNTFSSLGITIIRDVNELKYKDQIRSFMSSIRDSDFAIILLSNQYLYSSNCLYELIELKKELNFEKKIIPVLIDGTNIYSFENKLLLISYWESKIQKSKKLLKSKDPTKVIHLIREIKSYENILSELDSILEIISNLKNIFLEEALQNNFIDLINYLNISYPNVKSELIKIRNIENFELQEIAIGELKKTFPSNPDILFFEGLLNFNMGNLNKAKLIFESYIKIEQSVEGYNNLGLVYRKIGLFEKSDYFFKEGLKLDNESYELNFNIGLLRKQQKRYDEALEFLLIANNLNSQLPECLFSIALIYTNIKGDLENGLKFYLLANLADPNRQESYSNIASIFLSKGEFKKAEKYLKTALEINSSDYHALYNLGALNANVFGKIEDAKLFYRESIRINSLTALPKLALAKLIILHEPNNYWEAKELLKDVLYIEPQNNVAKELLNFITK